MRATTYSDIIDALDTYHLKIGIKELQNLEEQNDGCFTSIINCDNSFIIDKEEWNRSLILVRKMPMRAVKEWWNTFIDLGFLRQTDYPVDSAYVMVNAIKKTLEAFS